MFKDDSLVFTRNMSSDGPQIVRGKSKQLGTYTAVSRPDELYAEATPNCRRICRHILDHRLLIFSFLKQKRRPSGRSLFCGNGTFVDFYSSTNEVTIQFVSTSASPKKGFQLEFSISGKAFKF